METKVSPFQPHLFVCTNKKQNKECCADKGSDQLRLQLKEWIQAKPEWKGRIRINASGCLDRCTEGIAIACYPDGEYWVKVEASNLEDLQRQITSKMNAR